MAVSHQVGGGKSTRGSARAVRALVAGSSFSLLNFTASYGKKRESTTRRARRRSSAMAIIVTETAIDNSKRFLCVWQTTVLSALCARTQPWLMMRHSGRASLKTHSSQFVPRVHATPETKAPSSPSPEFWGKGDRAPHCHLSQLEESLEVSGTLLHANPGCVCVWGGGAGGLDAEKNFRTSLFTKQSCNSS